MAQLGSTSTSALLRSASSTAAQLASIEDERQALDWKYGAQDEAAFSKYTGYLKTRQTAAEASGTLTGQHQALNLGDSIFSIKRQYRSGQIQEAAMAIQTGKGSLESKGELLKNLAMQAYNEGDTQNGQAIESLYNSNVLAQQTKSAAMAQAAAAGNAKAQAAVYGGYTDAIKEMTNATRSLENDFQAGKITPQAYAEKMSKLMTGVNGAYEQAGKDPSLSDDHKATFANAQNSLQMSSNYKLLGAPGMMEKLSLPGGGNLLTTTTGVDGSKQLSLIGKDKITGQHIATDEHGKTITDPLTGKPLILDSVNLNPKIDKLQSDVKSNGQAGINIQRAYGNTQEQIFPDKTVGQDGKVKVSGDYGYYIDSVTGKTVDVNLKTGEHILASRTINPDGSSTAPNSFEEQKNADLLANSVGQLDGGGSLPGQLTQGYNSLPGFVKDGIGALPGANVIGALMHPQAKADASNADSLWAGVAHNFPGVTGMIDKATQIVTGNQKASLFAQHVKEVEAANAAAWQNLQAQQKSFQETQAAQKVKDTFTAQHFATPTPVAAGGNNINKVLTQPVPTGNAAKATALVTGFGYGTGF